MATEVEHVDVVELPAQAMTSEDVETLRQKLGGMPDAELRLYVKVCDHLGLSPFRGEIVAVPYAGRWQHQVTVVGRRVLAARTGELRGIDGPYWCGPERNRSGQHDWLELWDGDDRPYAARVFVYRAGWVKPANGTVRWSEFGKTLDTWRTMPSHMLGKVAENLALGRAFPEVIRAAIATEWVEPDDATAASEPAGSAAEPHEYVRPTDEQLDEVKRHLATLGLDNRAWRSVVLDLASRAAGRQVTSTAQLWRHEVAALIERLAQMLDALRAAEAVEPERDEHDGDDDDG